MKERGSWLWLRRSTSFARSMQWKLREMWMSTRNAHRTPMKKIATPEEVATQIVLLSSEKVSSHTTGEITMLAGGMEGEFNKNRDCAISAP